MAKKEKEEAKQEEKLRYLPKMGTIVYYHKIVQTNQGEKIESFPALVLRPSPKEMNFKAEDLAVDLYIFSNARGGTPETRSVMQAATRQPGRYTLDLE